MSEMRATQRNNYSGLLADVLLALDEYAQKPRGDASDPTRRSNPVLGGLADLVGLGAIGRTVDRMSYGEPLTTGKGMATQLRPDTKEALLAAPISPRTAVGMATMGIGSLDNAANKAAIVWHGSPHKFDRFDASKIGTGEGAQAYGHGLYLAESPSVAKEYQRALGTAIDLEGKPVMRAGKLVGTTGNRQLDSNMELYAGDLNQGIKDQLSILRDKRYRLSLDDDKASWTHKANKQVLKDEQQQLAAMRNLRNNGKFFNDGSIYKVDLPDPLIARMLDWDKPLSQQAPEVRSALQAADRRAKDSLYGSGGEYYRALMSRHAQDMPPHMSVDAAENMAQAPASQQLRALGIPGIRYLDGGSRGVGQGTSNFVIFPGEENALRILERNGVPLGLLD